jgi:hypothetical protein
MPDIFSDVPIRAARESAFRAVSTPAGLDACVPHSGFELEMIQADPDWVGTRVGFLLEDQTSLTHVRFYRTGWPTANQHSRMSCYRWPIYFRLLRRHVEDVEFVPSEQRLGV